MKKFIPQSELSVKDFFPTYNEKYADKGLHRQSKFLFNYFSRPLHCPSCKKMHTINELTFNSPYFDGQRTDRMFCPETNEDLKHGTTLFGGEDYLYLD